MSSPTCSNAFVKGWFIYHSRKAFASKHAILSRATVH